MPEENPLRTRSSMLLAAGVVAVALVAAGGYYAWKTYTSEPAPETPPVQEPLETTATFASSTIGISFTYPKDFTLAFFQNTSVNPKKPINGVKVTIPLTMATGTNLADDTFLSVEQLPRAKNCTGDIYLAANVKPVKLLEENMTYSVATSSGVAAGNLYEEMIYAIASSSPCTAVRYFIHSSTIGNFPSGVVREFDRAALLSAFDKIRRSLTLQ